MNESVRTAVTFRIGQQHLDLIRDYGIVAVMEEIDNVSMYKDDLEEIGSSDISCWVNDIKKSLAARKSWAEWNKAAA